MIPLEQFTFAVNTKDEFAYIDLDYVIGIGDRKLNTYISEWSNSQIRIREQLETYVKRGDSRVEICFEDSPTIIFMNRSVAMASEENQVHLRIVPDEFHDKKLLISGYCDENQVIERLYAGLLFGMITRIDDIGRGYNWDSCKMVCYNRMKSYVVESYLTGTDSAPAFRNAIKHILVYTGDDFIRLCDESEGYHIHIADEMVIRGKDGVVLCTLNGVKNKLESNKESALRYMAQMLPSDFDLWDISDQNQEYIAPIQYIKTNLVDTGCHFNDDDVEITEYGSDPYGFTAENLHHACLNRDLKGIQGYITAGAEMSQAISWVLSNYAPGSSQFEHSGDPEPSDEELVVWDKEKLDIISYLLDCGADPGGYENHSTENLKMCIWRYCPRCMELLLRNGADPNLQDDESYSGLGEVKYCSVMNLINFYIEKEPHTKLLNQMKQTLEQYGARDFVIYKEQ